MLLNSGGAAVPAGGAAAPRLLMVTQVLRQLIKSVVVHCAELEGSGMNDRPASAASTRSVVR